MFSWGELFSTFMARKIMGMKGTCRSGNRGGVPLVLCSLYSGVSYFIPLHPSSPSPAYHQGQKASETGQNGAKVNVYLPAFVFSREFARPKGAKSKDIFGMWGKVVQDVRALAALAILLTSAKLY